MCVELTLIGEKEKKLDLISRSARQILGDVSLDVFIPAVTQKVRDEFSVLSFLDGYIFILYKEDVFYTRLQDTNYFKSILTKPVYEGRRKKYVVSLLDDSDLSHMRKNMESLDRGDFKPGEIVKVIKGNYRNLNAEVIEVLDDNKTVQVYVELRSKKIVIDFPATYLSRL